VVHRPIIVSSAAPDVLNSNAYLNHYAAAGLRAAAPSRRVLVEAFERLEETIRLQKPELVLLMASCLPAETYYGRLRHACDKADSRLAFWLLDDPYEFDANVRASAVADAIFVSDLWSSWHYIAPCPVIHLPMAASPEAHFRPVTRRSGPTVFFCGVSFDNRTRLLRDLKPLLETRHSVVLGGGWDTGLLPFARNLRVGNETLPLYYNSAELVLNVGRRLNLANHSIGLAPSTPGPRTFEAAMAGATQAFFVEGLEVEDYYTSGKEILLFDTARDFAAILERMSDEPNFSLSIGSAAQARTLAEHTYTHRTARILDVLALTDESTSVDDDAVKALS
jgi:spore maturation protein CgeB